MKFNYFDIHSHYNLKQFDADREVVIQEMTDAGVGTICVGVDLETSKQAVLLAEQYDSIWATVGQHPTDTKEVFNVVDYEQLAVHPRVVAIGECGFDYFRTPKEEVYEEQKKVFVAQIELAIKTGKPLMLHCRPSKNTMDAYQDAIDLLSLYSLQTTHYKLSCNFHFFVGDTTIAKQIVERGWTMSFDGPITFSREYDEVIRFLPIESIMAETDAPFAAPEPYRGARALPIHVREIVSAIARIRGEEEEYVRVKLLENVKRVFSIDISI
jgi:TatD DNase family protein